MTGPRVGLRRQLAAWRGVFHRITLGAQHRASAALGVDESARMETVLSMLENNRRRAPGYWIQLFLSIGIATARQRAALATLSRSAAKTAGRLVLEDSAGWSIRAAEGGCAPTPITTL